MSFLKNYTSEQTPHQTIAKIEAVLIRCGVSSIMKEYGPSGEIGALTFQIAGTPPVYVRLPADTKRALAALWKDYVGSDKVSHDGTIVWSNTRKRKKRSDFQDQAERTAWRLMQDWVEVQMSMIHLGQAETLQVFLPYVWDISRGRSFFQDCKERHFSELPAASADKLIPEVVS